MNLPLETDEIDSGEMNLPFETYEIDREINLPFETNEIGPDEGKGKTRCKVCELFKKCYQCYSCELVLCFVLKIDIIIF